MLSSPDTGVPILAPVDGRRRLILTLLAALLLGGLIYALWGDKEQTVGAGSTLAQPAVLRVWTAWRQAGNADNPLRPAATGGDYVPANDPLEYVPVGSLGGIVRMDDPLVDFAMSDYPLTTEGLSEKGLIQFPVVIAALAVVHNLDLPGGQDVRLDAPTLASIYTGEITRWNDPALAALNPGLALPDIAISPIHRIEGSGSTYNFASYLAAGDESFRQRYGVSSEIAWPGGTAVRGSGGMIEAVLSVPGAVGYVQGGQAAAAGLRFAALRNAGGEFHTPSPASVRAAVTGIDWSPATQFSTPIAASPDAAAYPMTTPVYAMVRAVSGGDRRRVLQFLRFFVHRSGGHVEPLGFLPLPDQGVEAVESYLAVVADPA